MEQKILIAGGAGFIGYHLTDYLIKQGYNVTVIDNLSTGNNIHLNSNFLLGNIIGDVSEWYDQIYNLACPASPKHYQKDPQQTLDTCYIGTKRLIQSCDKFLQASTSEVYGDPTEHPQTEGYNGNVNPVGPRSCYDEGKRVAETLCYTHNKPIVRIFNTYGPHMASNDGRVIPTFIQQALSNKPITIYGDGIQTRSLCYITDMVEALVLAMAKQHNQPINIGNPEEVTINQLAQTIIRLANSKSTIEYLPLPQDDPKQRCPDITRAKDVLGWSPTINLEQGLIETIKYFEDVRGI